MAVAGDIVANLTANTKGWSAGLRDAITPLNVFTTAVLGMAVKGVASFVSFGDELEKTSLRTGISAEALSGLSYATGQTDTSMESLTKGLTKQAQFMEKLGQGSTEAQETLKRLNITTGELAGLTGDEKFTLFADRLADITDVGERSAVAMKIFGKGAVDLMPLMSDGAEGINALTERAKELGLIMSTEDAQAAVQLGDAWDDLKLVGDALLRDVVQPLIPLFSFVVMALVDIVAKNGEWISTLTQTAVVIAAVVATVKAISLGIQLYTKSVSIAMAMSGPKGWIMLAAGVAAAGAATYALNAEFESLNGTFEQNTSALREKNQVLDEATAKTDALAEAVKKQAELGKVATDLLKSASDSVRGTAESARQQSKELMDSWLAAGSAVAMRLEDVWKLQANLLEKRSGFADSLMEVSDQLRVLRGEITETELKFEKMAEFGVSDEQIQKLREATKERDQLLADQEAAKASAEEKQRRDAEIDKRNGVDGAGSQRNRTSFIVDSLDRGSEAAIKAIFAGQREDQTPKAQLAELKAIRKEIAKAMKPKDGPTVKVQEKV